MKHKRPKPPSKIFIIKLDIFPYDCLVAINKTPEQVQKVMIKYGKPLGQDQIDYMHTKKIDSAGYLFHNAYNVSIIYIKSSTVKNTVTLYCHEQMHFIHHAIDKVGMKLTDETEEVYAYASEHLMNQFLSKY